MTFQFSSGDPLKWRVNIIISSRDLSRVLEPVVCLEIKLDSGETKYIEVPISKFHLMRQNVAVALDQMELCRKRLDSINQTIPG
ncbi:COMM domain-containing protein 5-like [Nilaparvata lugens]|uniref:COMM domain-containing protein 5-like n=1 Tax=Nilaparvata lugens TaxID=108931 RepID=UPI00193DC0E8|nr:COMM domain-containing protein 5-like [Nilaparvata lugens]